MAEAVVGGANVSIVFGGDISQITNLSIAFNFWRNGITKAGPPVQLK